MGHDDYFLVSLPGGIALFISSPGSYSVCCNLLSIMKKSQDPKPTIMPSRTRRDTTDLCTKSTLDSPSVLSQLVTPPSHHHTSRVASTGSDTVYDEFDDASVVLDESGSLGLFLNAMVAKSKEIESDETSNENIITPCCP